MMSPWDAIAWFDTPTERVVNLAAPPAWTKVAAFNPRRVVLLFGLLSATTVNVSTVQGAAGSGFTIVSGEGFMVLRQATDGPLAQMDWYAQPNPGTSLTVIEVLLRDWPHTMEGPPDDA